MDETAWRSPGNLSSRSLPPDQQNRWKVRLLRYLAHKLQGEDAGQYSDLGEAFTWWMGRDQTLISPPPHLSQGLALLDDLSLEIDRLSLGEPDSALNTPESADDPSPLSDREEAQWHSILASCLTQSRFNLTPGSPPDARPSPPDAIDLLVGTAPAWLSAKHAIRLAANCDVTALIIGEPGSGKSTVARAIHDAGARGSQPFRVLDCADIGESGSDNKLGSAGGESGGECSHPGTLLMENLDSLTPPGQIYLKRLLDQYDRSAPNRQKIAEMPRLLVTSTIPLDRRVALGEFRQDLYFRLSIFQIDLPPLRQRREDLRKLVRWFLAKIAVEQEVVTPTFDEEAFSRLESHLFSGNLRELETLLAKAAAKGGGRIGPDDIQFGREAVEGASASNDTPLSLAERRFVEIGFTGHSSAEMLARFLNGVGDIWFRSSRLAEELGVSVSTARSYITRLVEAGYVHRFGQKRGSTYRVDRKKLFG